MLHSNDRSILKIWTGWISKKVVSEQNMLIEMYGQLLSHFFKNFKMSRNDWNNEKSYVCFTDCVSIMFFLHLWFWIFEWKVSFNSSRVTINNFLVINPLAYHIKGIWFYKTRSGENLTTTCISNYGSIFSSFKIIY